MAFQQSVLQERAPALLAVLNTPPDSSDRYASSAVPATAACVRACVHGGRSGEWGGAGRGANV